MLLYTFCNHNLNANSRKKKVLDFEVESHQILYQPNKHIFKINIIYSTRILLKK